MLSGVFPAVGELVSPGWILSWTQGRYQNTRTRSMEEEVSTLHLPCKPNY